MQNPTGITEILTVDDDPLVRASYRAYFAAESSFRLVGEAATGVEAVAIYGSLQPDVVLMDLQMPEMSGVEATREICLRWPRACVVAVTTFGTREYVVAALRAGAGGYLLKDLGGQQLAAGIRQAMRGDMPLSSSVRRELVAAIGAQGAPPPPPVLGLTAREVHVLDCLVGGQTNRQISQTMFVSEGSVKQYLASIGAKFGVSSRTQILVKAIRLHVVDPDGAALPGGHRSPGPPSISTVSLSGIDQDQNFAVAPRNSRMASLFPDGLRR
ncbi:MAG: response regulator transcription factor [Micropruina sp.]|nr:response regulator transcription factor [Micropruina sp.]